MVRSPELDLNQISYQCVARMSKFAEIQFRDLINQHHESTSIHYWDLFLSCDVFIEYISIESVYFCLKY